MSPIQPTDFTLTLVREAATLTVRVEGELDYDTSGDFLDTVTEALRGTRPRAVRLDFADMTWIDSGGLSALLMVHRRTSALGATLHLDNQPAVLERVLRTTNVLDHLTAAPDTPQRRDETEQPGVTSSGTT